MEVDTRSHNVTPAWSQVVLDFRTATESPASLAAFVHEVAGELPHSIEIDTGDLRLADDETPLQGYYTPPDNPAVSKVRELVAAGMGREPALTSYRFATDGRLVADEGYPIIGYSPGAEDQAHIAGERISIALMEESLRGHLALLQNY